ncbi:MAG TPA: lysylphosphatidylglycerol synthase transmembrane domain-containing protein [Candidatus Acidoferrales bacterium]|nr:lysylphosphatidylglycerol synthase transmembrane domain-containing protein [Candidatus Acidoferrales bacterium]
MSRQARTVPWRSSLLRLAGSVAILALLFRIVPFHQAWEALRRLPPLVWLAVLAAYLCAHTVGAAKYRLTLGRAGAGLTFVQALRCYFAGLFGTLLLPSVVGGDVVRVGMALRLAPNRAGVILGSLVDRLLDVAVLLTLAVIGVLLAPSTLGPAGRRILLMIAAAGLAVGLAGLTVLLKLRARRFSYRRRRWLARLRLAARSVARRRERVLAAYGLGLLVQASFLTLTAFLAAACGLHLAVRAWLFAWPLAKLCALVPISQGGIGVREAALAALLAPFGAAAGLVVGVGLAWETVILAGGIVAGGAALAIARLPAGQSSSVQAGAPQRLGVPPS